MKEAEDKSRLCGRLELYSVYRTNLEIYSNVIVAMRYRPRRPYTRETFSVAVEKALHTKVLPQNPLLSCEIVNGASHEPRFRRKATRQLPIRLVKDCSDIQAFLRREHDERPSHAELWRISIVEELAKNTFWVSLSFHHAIGDGTSGLIFHEQLLRALQSDSSDAFLSTRPLPPSIEECGLNLQVKWKSLMSELPGIIPLPKFVKRRIFSPDYYAGKSTILLQRKSTKTGLRTLKLKPGKVQMLRNVAKANGVSIHALIHAAVSHSIDTELAIKSSTPISLRPLLPEEERQNFCNYVAGHVSSTPLQEDVVSTAKAFYAEIHRPETRSDALQLLGKLQYISNSPPTRHRRCGMEEFLMNALNSPHDQCVGATLEISNLGNWTPPKLEDWDVDDIHFTGSNSSIGELFNIGVVTIAGSLMNISCTWRTGYVDDIEVQRLLRKVDEVLSTLE